MKTLTRTNFRINVDKALMNFQAGYDAAIVSCSCLFLRATTFKNCLRRKQIDAKENDNLMLHSFNHGNNHTKEFMNFNQNRLILNR